MYSAEKKADGHDKLEYVSSRKVTIEEDGINVKKKERKWEMLLCVYTVHVRLCYTILRCSE